MKHNVGSGQPGPNNSMAAWRGYPAGFKSYYYSGYAPSSSPVEGELTPRYDVMGDIQRFS